MTTLSLASHYLTRCGSSLFKLSLSLIGLVLECLDYVLAILEVRLRFPCHFYMTLPLDEVPSLVTPILLPLYRLNFQYWVTPIYLFVSRTYPPTLVGWQVILGQELFDCLIAFLGTRSLFEDEGGGLNRIKPNHLLDLA